MTMRSEMHQGDATSAAGGFLTEIAHLIEKHAPAAGDHVTTIPALSLHRRHAPSDPTPCIYPLGLVLTAQGAKQVMVGDRILGYTPGQSMVVSVDVPITSHVTCATVHEPYLGLLLRLDVRQIADVASEMELPSEPVSQDLTAISIETLKPALLDALKRLVELLDEPAIVRNLAPLIEREIIVRLLTGPHSGHLRQSILEETPGRQVSRVVAWMKQNFATTIGVEELAERANMSPTPFRKHFRETTGMSPLQYLKQIRLQEARQLMLNQGADAGRAASIVGYQSASQFSREYSRLFGSPPQRDIQRMRSRKQSAGNAPQTR
jgi:AraC-like DNA-binding protein